MATIYLTLSTKVDITKKQESRLKKILVDDRMFFFKKHINIFQMFIVSERNNKRFSNAFLLQNSSYRSLNL